MKRPIDIKLVRFYLWTTLAYVTVVMMNDLHENRETFLPRLYDNLWRAPYLLAACFIFFEYTIPFVFRKRKYVIYIVLLGLAMLWVFMMVWSYGMYGWRQLGIALGVYTSFIK